MARRTVALAGAAFVAAGLLVAPTASASPSSSNAGDHAALADIPSVAAWSARCQPTKTRKVDPLLWPDEGPEESPSHLHEFFGNTLVDEYTDSADLRAAVAADTLCSDPKG